ncbi:unnamed protein product [Amoebophrya sp. A120]|nr:unnamed protein product [Amoebophrya sp. A120]|eukprot:GSA120T00022805001.1
MRGNRDSFSNLRTRCATVGSALFASHQHYAPQCWGSAVPNLNTAPDSISLDRWVGVPLEDHAFSISRVERKRDDSEKKLQDIAGEGDENPYVRRRLADSEEAQWILRRRSSTSSSSKQIDSTSSTSGRGDNADVLATAVLSPLARESLPSTAVAWIQLSDDVGAERSAGAEVVRHDRKNNQETMEEDGRVLTPDTAPEGAYAPRRSRTPQSGLDKTTADALTHEGKDAEIGSRISGLHFFSGERHRGPAPEHEGTEFGDESPGNAAAKSQVDKSGSVRAEVARSDHRRLAAERGVGEEAGRQQPKGTSWGLRETFGADNTGALVAIEETETESSGAAVWSSQHPATASSTRPAAEADEGESSRTSSWRHSSDLRGPDKFLGDAEVTPVEHDHRADARRLMYDDQKKLEAARVYGNIHKFAYYFVDLLIGHPVAQRTSVIIDTGSSLCGFPCSGCRHCGRHIDAAFDVSKSPSAKWIQCSAQCSCRGDKCGYSQGYTEGSSISGHWFEDYARLGDVIQNNPPVKVKMGCHDSENKLFYTQKANGIFGMAGNGGNDLRGKPTILADILRDREHVNANIFTMCLSQEGGRVIAGGYNSTYHDPIDAPITYVPLGANSKFYVVSLSEIKIGGQSISGNYGRTIVDSGTTYSYFPSRQYRTLKSQLYNQCKGRCGTRSGAECWNSPGTTMENIDSKWPLIEMVISGQTMKWHPRSYMYKKGRGTIFCFTFDDNGSSGTVLGASWMIDRSCIFDLEKKKIGFVDAHCPKFASRPRGPNADDFTGGKGHQPAGKPSSGQKPAAVYSETPSPPTSVDSGGAADGPPLTLIPKAKPVAASTAAPAVSPSTAGGGGSTSTSSGTASVSETSKQERKSSPWLPSYFQTSGNPDRKTASAAVVSLLALFLLGCSCRQLYRAFRRRTNYTVTQQNPDDGVPVQQWLSPNKIPPPADAARLTNGATNTGLQRSAGGQE